MHPILDSLSSTEHSWLRSLLFAFNSGDIGKYEALAPHFSKQVGPDPKNESRWQIKELTLSIVAIVATERRKAES